MTYFRRGFQRHAAQCKARPVAALRNATLVVFSRKHATLTAALDLVALRDIFTRLPLRENHS